MSLISSDDWMVRVFDNFPHTWLLAHTCLQQTSPPETTLQPLSDHSIALNVNAQLSGVSRHQTLPVRRSESAPWIKGANLNVSVLHAELFLRENHR
jgi:hypothetical protein